ncbi:MAG: AraC family transcriptional regulator [Pseudomonadota bacterium]
MQTRVFSIDSYCADGEAFHAVRKTLGSGRLRFLHTHDFFECFWVETGILDHRINGTRLALQPGDLVFVRPGDVHAVRGQRGAPCRIVNLLFRTDIARHLVSRYRADLRGRFFWSTAALPQTQRLSPAQRGRLRALAAPLIDGPRGLAQIEAFLLTLTTGLLAPEPGVAPHAPAWLTQACAAARDPEVFRDGAQGFVRAAGRAHAHVCRVAQQYLGEPPSAFVNRIRMDYAARQLAGSDVPITQIAADCGLENLSHFYRIFAARHGTTPRAYRQIHRRDPVQP